MCHFVCNIENTKATHFVISCSTRINYFGLFKSWYTITHYATLNLYSTHLPVNVVHVKYTKEEKQEKRTSKIRRLIKEETSGFTIKYKKDST